MTQINASLLHYQPFVSRDNPKALFLALTPIDFAIDSQFQIQAEAAQGVAKPEFLYQSVYLDAALITAGTTFIDVGTTGQTVAIRAGYQGYRPLLCNAGSQVFTFRNPGANGAGGSQILKAFLLNIPVVGADWGAGTAAVGALWG
jgi:hypothetical protein